jgi:hypothetical protein
VISAYVEAARLTNPLGTKNNYCNRPRLSLQKKFWFSKPPGTGTKFVTSRVLSLRRVRRNASRNSRDSGGSGPRVCAALSPKGLTGNACKPASCHSSHSAALRKMPLARGSVGAFQLTSCTECSVAWQPDRIHRLGLRSCSLLSLELGLRPYWVVLSLGFPRFGGIESRRFDAAA